jgi:hypothetical protein
LHGPVGIERAPSPPFKKRQNLAFERPRVVDVGWVRRVGNNDPPRVPQRALEPVKDVVERRWRPFAGNQERRRSDCLRVGARKWRPLLLDLAKQSGGVAAKHLPSVFWRPLPTARPRDHVNCGLKIFVDFAAPNSFGRLCVERAQRDRRWRRHKTCLEIRRQQPPGSTRTSERIRSG